MSIKNALPPIQVLRREGDEGSCGAPVAAGVCEQTIILVIVNYCYMPVVVISLDASNITISRLLL